MCGTGSALTKPLTSSSPNRQDDPGAWGQGRSHDRRWSRSRLLQLLRDLEREHGFAGTLPLEAASKAAGIDLRRLIREEFGTYGEAKRLAGARTWPLWSKKRVVDVLRKRWKSGPVYFRQLKKENGPLSSAIERLFGRWGAAARAAGIKVLDEKYRGQTGPSAPWKWSRRAILAVLKDAWKRRDIRIDSLRKHHAGIYVGALREFKTWQAALRSAGIPKYAYAHRMASRSVYLEKLSIKGSVSRK